MSERVGRSVRRAALAMGASLALAALGCGERALHPSDPAADLALGELEDAALFSDGTVVAAGHTGMDGARNLAVVAFDAFGTPRWLREEAIDPTVDARADAVEVDAGDRVLVAGSILSPTSSRGVVLAYDKSGAPLWQTEPFAQGSAELYALAVQGSAVYVTGYARHADPHASPTEPPIQGIAVARLDAASGVVEWQDIAAETPDPLRVSAGLSIAVDASGVVGVGGVAGFPDSRIEWFVGTWTSGGERRWQDVQDGPPGSAAPSAETGQIDVARKVAFDSQGDLYAVGDLAFEQLGTDLTLLKYAPDGSRSWMFRRDQVLADGTPSFDEGHALAVGADGEWVAGGMAMLGDGYVEAEGLAANLDPGGAVRWAAQLSDPSLSGEEIDDLVPDPDGPLYYGGSDSDGSIGKHVVIEKVDRDGTPLWTRHLTREGDSSHDLDRVNRLLLGTSGDLIAVGEDRGGPNVPDEPLAMSLDRVTGDLLWAYPPGLTARAVIE